MERAEDIRHSPWGKATYSLRKETIERVFADAKEQHGMRFTHHRGFSAVTQWCKMKFAAMNLKKFALHKARLSLQLWYGWLCFLYVISFSSLAEKNAVLPDRETAFFDWLKPASV